MKQNTNVVQTLLVGNGLDIQIGGMDFHNKWIIVRLLADAKAGKFDKLFKNPKSETPVISADNLVDLFSLMPAIGNKIRNGEYAYLIDKTEEPEVNEAIISFKSRYVDEIHSPEEIGLEDWFLLLRIFLQEQEDLLPQYETAKQGFERVILDAIYCDGNIQRLNKKIDKKAKDFYCEFDNIFTVNYDNNLERVTGKKVFHLHGDYETKAISEDPNTAIGYLRQQAGKAIDIPPEFQHCFCNAILDFSGDNKYKHAIAFSNAQPQLEKLKIYFKENPEEAEVIISKLPAEPQKIIRASLEQDLPIGHNYHFHEFEELTGELTIIGLAPQNDSHLFDCINRSYLKKVIFYHYGQAPDLTLHINKPYEIKDVKELWIRLGLQSPTYISPTYKDFSYKTINHRSQTQDFVDIFNSFETAEKTIVIEEIEKQLKSIPEATEKSIVKMLLNELQKDEYRSSPETRRDLILKFRNFGRTLVTAALSPQTLYFLYLSNIPKDTDKYSTTNTVNQAI